MGPLNIFLNSVCGLCRPKKTQLCLCVGVFLILSSGLALGIHITIQKCFLFFFPNSTAIRLSFQKWGQPLILSHYVTVPIVVTLCAIVQNLSWAMLGTNVCHWVACYLCIWLQEQLFVLGGFGMWQCGPGSNLVSHCSDLVYFCGGLVTAWTTGLRVC